MFLTELLLKNLNLVAIKRKPYYLLFAHIMLTLFKLLSRNPVNGSGSRVGSDGFEGFRIWNLGVRVWVLGLRPVQGFVKRDVGRSGDGVAVQSWYKLLWRIC